MENNGFQEYVKNLEKSDVNYDSIMNTLIKK